LFRVIVFSRVAEEFKRAAGEHKWTVRPYKPDQKKTIDRRKLEAEREKSKKHLIKLCRSMFSEVFVAWIHLKAIRTFVESVLRYALPTNFQCILVLPNKGKMQKLRKSLNSLYSHLQANSMTGTKEDEEDFFPYVYTAISLDFRLKT